MVGVQGADVQGGLVAAKQAALGNPALHCGNLLHVTKQGGELVEGMSFRRVQFAGRNAGEGV